MLVMSKPTMCKDCGLKASNRAGSRCFGCWVKAGKPKGGGGPRERAIDKGLRTKVRDELEAMEWVWSNPRDRTYQEQSLRALKDAEPRKFYELMRQLRVEKSAGVVKWDQVGCCPTCGREAERAEVAGEVERMIEELLEATEVW